MKKDRTFGHRRDLFIRRQTVWFDAESAPFYEPMEVSEPMWVVNCRNPRTPHRTALPVGFATLADATRAVQALADAGLHDTELMHERIKVQRDWNGVRRIMLEALMW